jgi:integrase/recombinase XerC
MQDTPKIDPLFSKEPFIERYLSYVRHIKRLSDRTHILYSLHLAQLQSLCTEASITSVTAKNSQIRRFVSALHTKGHNPRGMALIIAVWRGYYDWLGREGLIPNNPITGVQTPKVAKLLPKALSVDEAIQLAQTKLNQNDPWNEARDAAIVELLYGSSRGWIDMQAAVVHVVGKGEKKRSVPAGTQAILAIKKWLDIRYQKATTQSEDGARALFINTRGKRLISTSLRTMLRSRSLQAGLLQPVHPHMLRHSFASHILQSSGDLRAVQELLGHSNISTTQIYTRLDFQHLANIYDTAHPRSRRKKDD